MDKTPLETKELKELLIKCWMTHDAMWFYHCLQECGIEKTNRINRAAVKAVAARGLPPHKFTPVPGVHNRLAADRRGFPLKPSVRRNEVETIFDFPGLLG